MTKVADILNEFNAILNKTAFIPNPQVQQQQQQGQGQDPQQGQGGDPQQGTGQTSQQQGQEQGGDPMANLPPGAREQLAQLPPDQQQAVLKQLAEQSPEGQQKAKTEEVQTGEAPPTDLDNSTITLRVRDLLDLVSGGSATKNKLKIQEHMQKADFKQQQMQQKQQVDAKKQDQKQQQDEMKAQQDASMGSAGPNMMGGGIYPAQQPQQGQGSLGLQQ